MNIFTINGLESSTSGRIVEYKVTMENGSSVVTIYYGKAYLLPNTTSINIDLADILWNYRYRGEHLIQPTLNSTGDDYQMPYYYGNSYVYNWQNYITVETTSETTNKSVSKRVKLYNESLFGGSIDSNLLYGKNALEFDHQPDPHIPSASILGFYYNLFLTNGGKYEIYVDDTLKTTIDLTGYNRFTQQVTSLKTIQYTLPTKYYKVGDTTIYVDQCCKPYYLCWMTRYGGMQCQGFLKSTEFTMDYDAKTRVDMSDYEWNYSKNIKGKWKLKSQNLSDADYKAYGDIFQSPYVVLLDIENGRMHYVNVTTTTYTEKKNGVNSVKMPYFEIDVESCEVKNI